MNIEIQEQASLQFDFLCSRYGFIRKIISPSHVRFESIEVFFEITANQRDGICVDYGRFAAKSHLSSEQAESLSLNTFWGALKTYRGTLKRISADEELHDLAEGLKANGYGLIVGNSALYELTRQLKFWHVGNFVNMWGKSIVMTPEEIQKEKHLLPSIEKLISKINQSRQPSAP
jgi:hypothetical protein